MFQTMSITSLEKLSIILDNRMITVAPPRSWDLGMETILSSGEWDELAIYNFSSWVRSLYNITERPGPSVVLSTGPNWERADMATYLIAGMASIGKAMSSSSFPRRLQVNARLWRKCSLTSLRLLAASRRYGAVFQWMHIYLDVGSYDDLGFASVLLSVNDTMCLECDLGLATRKAIEEFISFMEMVMNNHPKVASNICPVVFGEI